MQAQKTQFENFLLVKFLVLLQSKNNALDTNVKNPCTAHSECYFKNNFLNSLKCK
jgi:hypothetical protein